MPVDTILQKEKFVDGRESLLGRLQTKRIQ